MSTIFIEHIARELRESPLFVDDDDLRAIESALTEECVQREYVEKWLCIALDHNDRGHDEAAETALQRAVGLARTWRTP